MVKIAVVGAGPWGKNHLKVWSSLGALSAICEADPEKLEEVQALYPGVRATTLLSDLTKDQGIEGIVLATPAETHHRLAKECLLSDKDVLVEKPLALTTEEGEELVRIAESRKRILMVGHLLQYHSAVRKIKELIDQGELGKINYLYSNRLNFGRIRLEENILWSFAPHDISLILMLLGEMPVSVSARGANYLHQSIADVTISSLEFRSGARAHIFVSWLHPFKEQKLVIVGDRKMAVFDDVATEEKLLVYPHRIEWLNRQPVNKKVKGEPVEVGGEEPLREECLHFLSCVETRSSPRTDGDEGLRVLKVLKACQESLEQRGKEVSIEATPLDRSSPYYVHPTSTVDIPCEIGEGTKIWHYSHIMKNSKIGRQCNLGQNVVISPYVVLGDNVKVQNNVSLYTGVICEDDVFLGPSMVFTNVTNPRSHVSRKNQYEQTLVKKGASIGANATIVCGHIIGRFAFIGAGAVVTKDVPDYALMVGNPARHVGWMCECGERIRMENEESGACTICHAAYRLSNGVMKRES